MKRKNSKDILRGGASIIVFGALAFTAQAHAQTAAKSGDTVVVVTGQRAALKSAQKIKKDSDQVVDSIVADDIGKLPDRSVTEVLQRVPGVSISHSYNDIAGHVDPEHFAVEGSGVTIRGMSYVESEINGRDSFSANGGRGLSFEDVPPELMAAVDVYKNPSASQIEGGISGLVNLRTAMPFDFKGMKISASVGGNYGDLAGGSVKPQASVLFTDRWHTGAGDVGLLVDLAHSESKTRTDGVEQFAWFPRVQSLEAKTNAANSAWEAPGSTTWISDGDSSWRTLAYDRKRDGQYVALQWRPNDSVNTSLTIFRSAYKFHWDEDAFFATVNPYNLVPAAGTNFIIQDNKVVAGTEADTADNGVPFNDDVRSADRTSVTTDASWKISWDVNSKLSLQSDLQYVYATTRSDDFTVATGVNIPYETFNLLGKFPEAIVDTSYVTNPNNYYWAFTMDGLSRAVGKEWAWRGDAEYRIDNGFFKTLRAGIRLTERSALTQLSEPGNGYNWAAVSQTWMLGWDIPHLAYLNQFNAPYKTFAFPNYMNGATPLPSPVVFPATSLANGWPGSFAKLQAFLTSLCLNPGCNGWQAAALSSDPSKGGLNTQSERTYATFAELSFAHDSGSVPFDGTVGVRVVKTQDGAHGYTQMSSYPGSGPVPVGATIVSFPGFQTPVTARNHYTNVLPALNLRFKFSSELQARIALSQGISRPDFSQLQAYTSLSASLSNSAPYIETLNGSANGNPYLKPTRSNNLDLTLEWYFAPTGSLTGALFHKDLTDVVVNELENISVPDSTGHAQAFTTTSPVNGAKGTVNGMEIAYQQYYDQLPGWLKGFGLQANFTFIDSVRKLYTPVTGAYCDSSNSQTANLSLNLNGCDTDGRTFGNLPLQNLSKYAYNLTLLYDRGPVSARLAYNWRSRYLLGVNVNAANGGNGLNTDPNSPNYGTQTISYGLPVYGDDYGQLDGGIFYKVNDRVTLGFEAQNLLDATYKEIVQQHIGYHGLVWYKSGRGYTAQLRVTF
jgi:TonB-dependent receptor